MTSSTLDQAALQPLGVGLGGGQVSTVPDPRPLLHGVVEHHVLFGQFQQHGVVEELADTHVLAQSLQGPRKPRVTTGYQAGRSTKVHQLAYKNTTP